MKPVTDGRRFFSGATTPVTVVVVTDETVAGISVPAKIKGFMCSDELVLAKIVC